MCLKLIWLVSIDWLDYKVSEWHQSLLIKTKNLIIIWICFLFVFEKADSSHHQHVPSSVSSFTNIQQLGRTYSQRVPSFGYWHLRYHHAEPSLVKFNLSFPTVPSPLATVSSAPSRLAIYGNRDKPATHTRYDFVEFIGRFSLWQIWYQEPCSEVGSDRKAPSYGKWLPHIIGFIDGVSSTVNNDRKKRNIENNRIFFVRP